MIQVRCSSCGNHYFFVRKCPLCGESEIPVQNRLAGFLLRPREIGSVVLNTFYLYILLSLNLSLLCMIVNILVYQTSSGHAVWCHYVAGVLFAGVFFLWAVLSEKKRILSRVRSGIYVGIFVCAVTQLLLWGKQDYAVVSFVIPVLLILFDLFCMISFSCKWTTFFSFVCTLLLNTAFAAVPFVLMFYIPLPPVAPVLIDIAFGGSLLLIVNVLFLKFLSVIYRLREGGRR